MLSNARKGAAGLALLLLLALSDAACGREFPAQRAEEGGAGAPELRVWVDEQRRMVAEDPANRYRLTMPAPYWECSTAGQIAAEVQGRGCVGASRLPPGLLLLMRNKDASVQAVLYLLPERFLLRGKGELENYVNTRQQQMRAQGGATVEFPEPPSYGQEKGLVIHRSAFVLSAQGQKARGLVIHYFVRPKGEDVRVYRLECIATEKEFEREQEELEHIVGSFRFTGELSPEFFAPDAPDERLPDLMARPRRRSACGQGYWGMLVAVAAVLVLYMFMRRRSSRPAI